MKKPVISTKKSEISIAFIDYSTNKPYRKTTQGYSVIFPAPFSTFAFLVHRELKWGDFIGEMWKVTELKSGCSVPGSTAKTRQAAVTQTLKTLRKCGIDKFKKSVRKAMRTINR